MVKANKAVAVAREYTINIHKNIHGLYASIFSLSFTPLL